MSTLRRAYAASRIGLAAVIAVAPERTGRTWMGDVAADPATHGPLRSVAARDACLGAAAWADRRAVRLGMAADVADALTAVDDYRRTHRTGALTVLGLALFGLAFGVLVEATDR